MRNTKVLCICWHTSLTNLLSIFINKIHSSVDLSIYSHGTVSNFSCEPLSLKSILKISVQI